MVLAFSIFMVFFFAPTQILTCEGKCSVQSLNLAVVLDTNSSALQEKWTRKDLFQNALNRLKKDTKLLTSTHINLSFFYSNLTSVGRTLEVLCRDILPQEVRGIVSMQGRLPTQLLTRFVGMIGLPVFTTSRSLPLLNQDGYSNAIYLLPPLHEQAKVINAILQSIGAEKYKLICETNTPNICNSRTVFARSSNITIEQRITRAGLLNALAWVKFEGTRVIVLDCTIVEAGRVIDMADELEMLTDQYMWLVTEGVLGALEQRSVARLPYNVLGVRLNVSEEAIAVDVASAFLDMMDARASLDCTAGTAPLLLAQITCSNWSTTSSGYSNKVMKDYIRTNNQRYKHWKYSILKRANSTTHHFHVVAMWSNTGQIAPPDSARLLEQYRQFGRYSNSNSTRLRIVTIEHGQYTFQIQNVYPKCPSNRTTCLSRDRRCQIGVPCTRYLASNHGNSSGYTEVAICISGLMIELLKMIQSYVDFSYDIYLIRDNKYGGIDPKTGQWNGMIGDILSGEADMALATLTITASRSRVVDFSAPYGEVGIGILARTDSTVRSIINMDFLAPLSGRLWAVIGTSILTVTVTLWILDHKSWEWYLKGRSQFIRNNKKRVRFLESMSYTWSTFVHVQAGTGLPMSTSARLVAVFFALAMLIVNTSYTAELAAHKVKETFTSPITGIYDNKMLDPPQDFRYATLKDSSTEAYFRFSEDFRLRRIYQNMKDHNVDKVEDGVNKLLSGELQLYIDDQPYLQHLVSSSGNCALRILGNTFGVSGYGIALGKHSAWTRPISNAIIKLNDMSALTELWGKWLKRKCVKLEEFGKRPSGLSINSVNGLFVLVCAGIASGVLFLSIEHAVYWVRARRRGVQELVRESESWRRQGRYVARTTVTNTRCGRGLINTAYNASTSDITQEAATKNTKQRNNASVQNGVT